MTKRLTKAVVAGLFSLCSFAAHAGLIGSTAKVDFYFPDTSSIYCSSGTTIVGAGVEYPSGCEGFDGISIDIGDGLLTVSLHGGVEAWAPGLFNGFELDILGGLNIVSAAFAGGTMNFTNLFINDGDLWLDFAGQSAGTAIFDIAISNSSVPEPGSIGLMGLGLIGLVGLRRKVVKQAGVTLIQ